MVAVTRPHIPGGEYDWRNAAMMTLPTAMPVYAVSAPAT
jgi:hypothetical protein